MEDLYGSEEGIASHKKVCIGEVTGNCELEGVCNLLEVHRESTNVGVSSYE